MTQKERLVGLLRKCPNADLFLDYDEFIDVIADIMIDNGIIVPPCKVGDTVYGIEDDCLDPTDDYCDNVCSSCKYHCMTIRDELIGSWYKSITVMRHWRKYYFPTREEAKQALKERLNHGI